MFLLVGVVCWVNAFPIFAEENQGSFPSPVYSHSTYLTPDLVLFKIAAPPRSTLSFEVNGTTFTSLRQGAGRAFKSYYIDVNPNAPFSTINVKASIPVGKQTLIAETGPLTVPLENQLTLEFLMSTDRKAGKAIYWSNRVEERDPEFDRPRLFKDERIPIDKGLFQVNGPEGLRVKVVTANQGSLKYPLPVKKGRTSYYMTNPDFFGEKTAVEVILEGTVSTGAGEITESSVPFEIVKGHSTHFEFQLSRDNTEMRIIYWDPRGRVEKAATKGVLFPPFHSKLK